MLRDEAAGAATIEVLEEPEAPRSPPPAGAISLEELVSDLPAPAATPEAPRAAFSPAEEPALTPGKRSALAPGLRTARVIAVEGRRATVALRGGHAPVDATIAPDVEADLIAEAAAHKESALVEVAEDGEVLVVGLVQTRRPRDVRVTGEKIVIEAEREVLLRAGRAALRLREDGDVELVGSRISAASRGLFRIVGRILRLN